MGCELLQSCVLLVNEQHLQMQGWLAVVANLEHIARYSINKSTVTIYKMLLDTQPITITFRDFNKNHCQQFILSSLLLNLLPISSYNEVAVLYIVKYQQLFISSYRCLRTTFPIQAPTLTLNENLTFTIKVMFIRSYYPFKAIFNF